MRFNPEVKFNSITATGEVGRNGKLIDLTEALPNKISLLGSTPLLGWLERALAIDSCNAVYRTVIEQAQDGANFFAAALEQLKIDYLLTAEELDRIPRTGPLLVVANHPFGAVDGLILGALLSRARPDMRLLVNQLLNRIQPMQQWNIGINPFGGKNAKAENLNGMRECLRWLKQGGVIATFPAGTVSHVHLSKGGRVEDSKWSHHIATLAMRCQVPVLPVYFCGRNSSLFQSAGFMHPRLRTALLPEEMVRLRGKSLRVRIGKLIPAKEIKRFTCASACTDYLRSRTYLLRHRPKESNHQPEKSLLSGYGERCSFPFAGQDRLSLQSEVDALPADCEMLRSGDFAVYCSSAEHIPRLLLHIGSVREQTFRAVGEGTGKAIDLDRFDQWYEHLFLWDHAAQALAGAYRLGRIDEIIATRGEKGLYSATLFRFDRNYLQQQPPTLELGRSFVAGPYQLRRGALALIWRGIGEYLVRAPKYRYLTGPVSISGDYQALSRDLIIRFLNQRHPPGAFPVRPRKAPRLRRHGGFNLKPLLNSIDSMDAVDLLVSEIEPDGRGIPVLLRHYLKLNAQVLGFNVDPSFSNVVDGLIRVDLLNVETTLLARYLGKEGAAAYLNFHRQLG